MKLGLFGLLLLVVSSSYCIGNCEKPGAAILAANWSEVEGPPAGTGAGAGTGAAPPAAPEVSNGGRDISPGCARRRSSLRPGSRLGSDRSRSKLRGTSSQSKSRLRSAPRYRLFPGADDDEGRCDGGCCCCCGGGNDSKPRSRSSLLSPRSRSRENEKPEDLESDLLRREDEDEDEGVLPSRALSFPPPLPPPPLLPPIKALNMVTGKGGGK